MNRTIIIILYILLLVGVFLLFSAFMNKTEITSPGLPGDDTPNPNNVFTDIPTDDNGKQAYSAYGNATRMTLNFNTVDTPAKDALLGTVTGEKRLGDRDSEDIFYVLDNKYLVSKGLVRLV